MLLDKGYSKPDHKPFLDTTVVIAKHSNTFAGYVKSVTLSLITLSGKARVPGRCHGHQTCTRWSFTALLLAVQPLLSQKTLGSAMLFREADVSVRKRMA